MPVGTGVLLFGGRTTASRATAIYGNYLAGFAMVEGILLDKTEARDLIATRSAATRSALAATDLNGRDLAFDGNGTGQLLRPEHRRREHAAGRPGGVPRVPVQRRERVQPGRADRAPRLPRAPTR